MEFPIAGVTINPLLLIFVGFLVGILGGFFGVGGGFLAGPLLFWTGVPMNFVVGTDLAHMTGKSIVAAKRHRTLGHVDVKLGFLMVIGTIIGVELGARLIEMLESSGQVDLVVGIAYVVILLTISLFTAWESIRALRMIRVDRLDVKDVLAVQGISRRIYQIKLRPMIALPQSGIEAVSLWVVLVVGLISGVLAGFLGVGGGFIRMPMLVYVVGVPTHVAVGTDLFEIMISAGYGTLTHALKGNVDILIALVMHTGAAIGAQIGAVSTRFFAGPGIRLLFSFLPLLGAVLVLIRLLGGSGGG
ncbi:MAG: sulfite exporter TauE/SafE family protein [Ardenticatenaceae bacterium]|nr:sulfite exporter TauE/SafE family protein [Anaerolineales bacterium]MCB8916440.1 sulfite exporter TauE/SafE family protein [Ardenticatenaceae bacterium]